jgi:hypothetical protein
VPRRGLLRREGAGILPRHRHPSPSIYQTVSLGNSVNKPPADVAHPSRWHHALIERGSTPAGGKRLDEEGMPCLHKRTRL